MSDVKKVRVLVVDDDIHIRRALRLALVPRGYEVELASNGEEALDLAYALPPDIIVLDLAMPGMGGLAFCRELRSWCTTPIIVLSVRDKESDKVEALDQGADDYLTKPFSVDELLARIRAHLRRTQQTPSREAVLEAEGLVVDLAHRLVSHFEKEVKLTKTEFALLHYLMRNPGRVVTYTQLLGAVWGDEYANDTKTLRVHIGNLRRKIETDPNRPRYIITESGIGYRFVPIPTARESESP